MANRAAVQVAEGQGLGGRESHTANLNPLGLGTQASRQGLLLGSSPDREQGRLLTRKQPPLAPLHRDQPGGSLTGLPPRGHLPGQQEGFTGLAGQGGGREGGRS